MKNSIVISLCALIICACSHQQNINIQPESPLSSYWKNYFEASLGVGITGYAYAVYQNGKPVAEGSSGYAIAPNKEYPDGRPMSVNTRMQIASCSKPITAVSLLHLLESKGISVDTKVWDILKSEFSNPGLYVDQIRIKDLLNHGAGYNFGYIETPYRENAQVLLSEDIPNKPDGKYRYSNINTALARLVLEVLSGETYFDYVKHEILDPINAGGMKLNVSEEEAMYVYKYGDSNDQGKPMAIDFTDEAAAYGWYATVEELIRFVDGVRTRKFLNDENTIEMFENELGWGKRDAHYGAIYAHDGQWIIGGGVGIRTGVGIFPNNVVAVLFINTNGPYFPGLLIREGMENVYPKITFAPNRRDTTAQIHFRHLDNDVELRWTSDGSEPTIQSQLYNEGIILKRPVRIKVKGFKDGFPATFTNTREIK